jgi:hypothetical protein
MLLVDDPLRDRLAARRAAGNRERVGLEDDDGPALLAESFQVMSGLSLAGDV